MSARLRPRFRLSVDLDADSVMDVFRQRKEEGSAACILHLYEHQVEFSVRAVERHFWSPFLKLIVETTDEGTRLYGKYGPNVNVWSMFMAAYVALSLTGSVGLVIGFSQLSLRLEPAGFQISAWCAVGLAVVYAVGRVGRQLAHPQMLVFHNEIETMFANHIIELRDEETS